MACVCDENTPPNLAILAPPAEEVVKIQPQELVSPARGTKTKRCAAACDLSLPTSKRPRLSSLLILPSARAHCVRARHVYDASAEAAAQSAALALVCASRLCCASRVFANRTHHQLQRIPSIVDSQGFSWRECRLWREMLQARLNQARGASDQVGSALFDAAMSTAAISAALVIAPASHGCVVARPLVAVGMQSLERCATDIQNEQRMLQQQWQQRWEDGQKQLQQQQLFRLEQKELLRQQRQHQQEQQQQQQELLRQQRQHQLQLVEAAEAARLVKAAEAEQQELLRKHQLQLAASPAGTVSSFDDSDAEDDAPPG